MPGPKATKVVPTFDFQLWKSSQILVQNAKDRFGHCRPASSSCPSIPCTGKVGILTSWQGQAWTKISKLLFFRRDTLSYILILSHMLTLQQWVTTGRSGQSKPNVNFVDHYVVTVSLAQIFERALNQVHCQSTGYLFFLFPLKLHSKETNMRQAQTRMCNHIL